MDFVQAAAMVRVRIAPSPTGDPHVGTAYIALFNYVFAKAHQGTFILRIEDTDQSRSQPAWETMIVEALRWLGLDWSEGPDVGGPFGPYRQSERQAIYREYAEKLLASGHAYRCFCSSERLAQLRITQRQRNLLPGYDGHCRTLGQQQIAARLRDHEPYVVRLRIPANTTVTVHDGLRGEVSFASEQIDEQILLKSDGMPTYHLANVVDDYLMQITHVIRAEEWLVSTPKHSLLYQAFGWPQPQWIHMPLLRNSDRSKISKRKNPVSLNYYRQAGYLPEAMRNYLALMGWTMPDGQERFGLEAMIDHFDFSRISLGGPIFDIQKLTWLNAQYIRDLPPEKVLEAWQKQVFTTPTLLALLPHLTTRLEKLEDLLDAVHYFFSGDVSLSDSQRQRLVPKGRSAEEIANGFFQLAEWLDTQAAPNASSLEIALRGICQQLALKPKELFMAVRIAVTGREATPPLFDTLALLGKERCRRRLRAAIQLLKTDS